MMKGRMKKFRVEVRWKARAVIEIDAENAEDAVATARSVIKKMGDSERFEVNILEDEENEQG